MTAGLPVTSAARIPAYAPFHFVEPEKDTLEAKGVVKDETDRLFSGLRRSPARPTIGNQRGLDRMFGAF
jgi:hypothetical protein